MKKHAYLIMAHNNFYCLEKLMLLLDDERNDIFLHIDRKVRNFDFSKFRKLCKKACVIYPKKRMDVRWGTGSQVRCEMLLFRTAVEHGEYAYYHLLSGSDLPLVCQERMHEFFAGRSECFMTVHEELTDLDYQRISRYHGLFGRTMPWSNRLNGYAALFQQYFKIDRIRSLKGMTIKRGWNWVSIPHSAAKLLVDREKWIRKITRFSICSDEMYKQLVLLNSDQTIFRKDGKHTSMRYVDWARREGNHPHTFVTADYEQLTQSDALFARKFNERVDREIIDRIYDYVRKQETHI